MGHFLDAGAAPGCPEIDQHDFSAHLAEVDDRAIDRSELDVDRLRFQLRDARGLFEPLFGQRDDLRLRIGDQLFQQDLVPGRIGGLLECLQLLGAEKNDHGPLAVEGKGGAEILLEFLDLGIRRVPICCDVTLAGTGELQRLADHEGAGFGAQILGGIGGGGDVGKLLFQCRLSGGDVHFQAHGQSAELGNLHAGIPSAGILGILRDKAPGAGPDLRDIIFGREIALPQFL